MPANVYTTEEGEQERCSATMRCRMLSLLFTTSIFSSRLIGVPLIFIETVEQSGNISMELGRGRERIVEKKPPGF